ncbi:hypothetical protein [Bacteroides thetaiotaomicron]|uniref:hypothetical protein n=1 Tax=Bacteroides thetaiotaomicron TaxID=818 RepID=UPI0035B3D70D
MNENPNNIKRRIYERLMAVKDNVLSPANLASKVDYYKDRLWNQAHWNEIANGGQDILCMDMLIPKRKQNT